MEEAGLPTPRNMLITSRDVLDRVRTGRDQLCRGSVRCQALLASLPTPRNMLTPSRGVLDRARGRGAVCLQLSTACCLPCRRPTMLASPL